MIDNSENGASSVPRSVINLNSSSDAVTVHGINTILLSHGGSVSSNGSRSLSPSPPQSCPVKWDMEALMNDTDSLRSFVSEHTFENGRRYPRNRKCYFPNDESESERLDLMHHIFLLLLEGGLFVSPLKDPVYVLDIGCGTGIWCMDMGDKFPNATIIGTDVSPIQPEWVPPNVAFHIDDAELEWNFSHSFDFIHVRYMRGAISDWPRLYRQIFENLNPGGYVEIIDPEVECYCDDGSLPANSDLHLFTRMFHEAMSKIGRKTKDLSLAVPNALEQVGFVEIKDVVKKAPLNVWPRSQRLKELGAFSLMACDDGIEGICLKLFTEVYGWTKEQVSEFCGRVKKEMRNSKNHVYFRYHFVSARKPLV